MLADLAAGPFTPLVHICGVSIIEPHMRRSAPLFLMLLAFSSQAVAQASNMETYEALATACVGFMEDIEGDLVLDAPAHMPYVRSAIISALQAQGHTVFSADSSAGRPGNLATLRYTIDEARVGYSRLKKKQARREVHLTTTNTLIAADSRLLEHEVCQQQSADTVAIGDIASLESSAYAETRATPPETGFARRYLQPVLLTGATVLTVYLFFTLRSENSSDGN